MKINKKCIPASRRSCEKDPRLLGKHEEGGLRKGEAVRCEKIY